MAFVFPPPLPSFSPSSLLASHVCERHRSAVGRSAGASPRLASRHPSPRPCPTRLAWLAHTSPSTLATSFILARHGPSVSEKMPWRTHCKSRLPFLAFGSAGQAQRGGRRGGFLAVSCHFPVCGGFQEPGRWEITKNSFRSTICTCPLHAGLTFCWRGEPCHFTTACPSSTTTCTSSTRPRGRPRRSTRLQPEALLKHPLLVEAVA